MNFKFCLLLLLQYNLYSQSISGFVFDEQTNKRIENANISLLNKGFVVYTGDKGEFLIKITDSKDKLIVSALGYENKIIELDLLTENKVYLQSIPLLPKYEELKNVIVLNKNLKYKVVKLNPQKVVTYSKFNNGHFECVLIKNEIGKKGKLKEITLNFETSFGRKDVNRLTNFRILFYEYIVESRMPGKQIAFTDVVLVTQSKVNKLAVNLEHLDIPFPDKGVCLSIIALNRDVEVENLDVLKTSKIVYKPTASLFKYSDKYSDFSVPQWTSNSNHNNEWTNEKLKLLTNDLLKLDLVLNFKIKIQK